MYPFFLSVELIVIQLRTFVKISSLYSWSYNFPSKCFLILKNNLSNFCYKYDISYMCTKSLTKAFIISYLSRFKAFKGILEANYFIWDFPYAKTFSSSWRLESRTDCNLYWHSSELLEVIYQGLISLCHFSIRAVL